MELGIQPIDNTGPLKFKWPTHHGLSGAQFSLSVTAAALTLSDVKIIGIGNY